MRRGPLAPTRPPPPAPARAPRAVGGVNVWGAGGWAGDAAAGGMGGAGALGGERPAGARGRSTSGTVSAGWLSRNRTDREDGRGPGVAALQADQARATRG